MVGEHRFLIRARVIGAVIKDNLKRKMFMISVLWSDAAEVIVYRSWQDFKTFHGELKKRFPQRNPFQKKTRQIPKLKGRVRMIHLQQIGSNEPVGHMKCLEKYCVELLKCDPVVTQSSEVTQFLMPKGHDLESDFTKNSAIIVLSDSRDEEEDNVTHQHASVITQPFVTQTYKCVAAYETKDMKNRPFKVAEDEKLDVLIKDPAGWWLVEKEDKCLAWFPAPYLELWESKENDNDEFQQGGAFYCAIRNYIAKDADELSVPIGSAVEVLRKSDNGWWFIRFNGKVGYIPSMYLQPYNNPRAGLRSLQRRMHSSSLDLAASFDSSYSADLNKESGQLLHSARPARGRLQKAHSVDILSEGQSMESDASMSSAHYTRTMTTTSSDSNFSGISSSSESFAIPSEVSRYLRRQGNVSESRRPSSDFSTSDRCNSSQSSEGSTSRSSRGSETASAAFSPVIPCRPKTEEILSRCSTMTRKAALASRSRLQIQSKAYQSQ